MDATKIKNKKRTIEAEMIEFLVLLVIYSPSFTLISRKTVKKK